MERYLFPIAYARAATHKIFVGGLSWQTNASSLRERFSEFGCVANAYIILESRTGRSRGFGFVEFFDEKAANRVLQAPHFVIDGRHVRRSSRQVECKRAASRSDATSFQERRVLVEALPPTTTDCAPRTHARGPRRRLREFRPR
eukprot:gnl/Chilomastix_cuspidata/8856.p1 GENE.gnl/Chilomastix_cuspidata/8856~~gnl/Chilomastix_cuspidata/8856.p1  ORF type:complete len:144 (+),score=34.36 gnl/Chilomastix_cuspidata/8856:84-515(+)